ncbi:chlororespiratory reduction 6 domain-containing protein [Sphingobacterium sp. PCS056]|uniref:chlororespiratory reduction 6 domain-containing protein n=1 Tax=Sphingobacterium sp. PCS056 TaxID=2931400 RepID=UPI00200D7579|nr:chlororespiratory reduction 6 domain-containing protein [Sphingobacterium sp. PCS056]UPZ35538.1 chlororespiratory reduction 6 domain-containing protein [Sphingobacterium sp. PCS056]
MEHDKYALINLVISKMEIDSLDFNDVLNTLTEMHETPKKYFNKLVLTIHGYDNDNREVYEIPEIRNFLQFLDRSFPYWFYYLNTDFPKEHSSHGILASCICEIDNIVQVGNVKNLEFDLESLETFVLNHFKYMNEIMEKEGCTEIEIKELSDRVLSKLM